MNEELTEAMHGEFTLDVLAQKRHRAWAAFEWIENGGKLADVLEIMSLSVSDLTPFVADWNALSAKKIILE